MKKILFLIALFTLFVGANSYAKKDYLYSTGWTNLNGDCSYSEGVFSWKAGWNNTAGAISFSAGTLSKYSKIGFTCSNLSAEAAYRIIVKFEGSSDTYQYEFSTAGDKEISVTDLFKQYHPETIITPEQIATVNEVRFGGVTGSGSVEIDPTTIYLESDEYEAMGISTTIDGGATVDSPFQWYTSSDGTTKTVATGSLNAKNFNTAGIKEIFGKELYGVGYGNGFIDVTGYDKITVNIASFDDELDKQVRLLQATSSSSTTNYDIDVTKAGATTASLSGLTTGWIAGIWTQQYSTKSQAITSFVFTKDFRATSASAFNIAASASSTISYDRSFTGDQASTVCFPFALTQDECNDAGEFYELTDFDGKTLTFTKVTYGGTTAYKPYLFKATSTGTPFSALTARAVDASSGAKTYYSTPDNGGYSASMTGTLAHQSLEDGVYGWNSTDGVFSVTDGTGVAIDAFRAYISVSGVSTARLGTLFVDSSLTGINEVSNSEDVKSAKNFEGKVFENGKIFIFKKGMKFNAAGAQVK